MISILVAVVIAGFICWLVTLIPMQPVFKQIFIGLCVLFLILYVLQALGIWTPHWNYRA